MKKVQRQPKKVVIISNSPSSDSDNNQRKQSDISSNNKFSNISSIPNFDDHKKKTQNVSNISMDESFDEGRQSYKPPKKKRNSFLDRMITNGVINMLNRQTPVPEMSKSQVQSSSQPKFKKGVMTLQMDKLQQSESFYNNSKLKTTISPKQVDQPLYQSQRQYKEKEKEPQTKLFNNPIPMTKNVTFKDTSKDISKTISPITERVSVGSKASIRSPNMSAFSPLKGSPLEMSPENDNSYLCLSNRPTSNFRSRFQLQNLMSQHLPELSFLLKRIRIRSPQKPQKTNRDEVQKFINKVIVKQEKFVDDEFPPNISALCIQPTDQLNYRFQQYNSWETASNLVSENLSISRVRDPSCFEVGFLKDQGLISVLAAIANDSCIIMRIFEDQQINQQGIYYVRICRDGIWHYVILDDYFPYDFTKKDFMFVRQKADNYAQINDFWVELLEKGFSKVYGTYQDLEMSKTPISQFLRDLTGAPVEKIQINSFHGDIEELIHEVERNKYIMMVTNEKSEHHRNYCKQHGIPPDYSFQVLGIHDERVAFKNPFGWVDKKNVMVDRDIEQGLFFIPMLKFGYFFDQLVICQYERDYYYSARHTRHLFDSYSILEFQKNLYGLCTFEAHQPDQRLFRAYKSQNPYTYTLGRLIIVRQENISTPRFYNDTIKPQWNYIVECDLEPGIYRIIVLFDWINDKKIFDVNVSAYGEEHLELERINIRQDPNLLGEVMINEAKQHGKKYKTQNIVEYVYASENERLLVIAIENRSDKTVVFKKDYSFLDQKKLKLMTYLTDRLPTPQLKTRSKSMVFQEKQELKCEFELKQIVTKSIVFKIIDKDIEFDSKILKNFGFQ